MPSSHEEAAGWEALFWSVFERSTNAIALIDEQRVYVEVNAAFRELWGAPYDEIVGVRADRFVAPEEVATLEHEWRELSLVALGYTSAQIAQQLVVSTETVRTHVRNAMAKTGARTRAQLVAIALADRHLAAQT